MATVDLLTPDIFASWDGLVAGFTTRHGGVSDPPYDTLNLGLHTDDDPSRVRANRERFCAALDMTPDQMVTAEQVHGNHIVGVEAPGRVPQCDGFVTSTAGLLLCIHTADCAAVLLADPESQVVGACHAGWRGAAAQIPKRAVQALEEQGARPNRLRAYISPCISAERFEVGPEVAEQFGDPFVQHPPGAERPHVDLKASIADQLHQTGVPKAHIEVSPHCTMSDTDRFFSYRAEDGSTGRMIGFIGRRP